ncbi:Alpha-N-acetylgalactosaminide alpha-2,6-sialyltransferase 3 [Pitangus sulphuratus]|nr:Alpha-N-acetylgalactosaminide alpha-2,6-sialyltransferase 3 [Pitangus sulphuratus]
MVERPGLRDFSRPAGLWLRNLVMQDLCRGETHPYKLSWSWNFSLLVETFEMVGELFQIGHPLQLDCDLCAVVSNSGQMAGQKVGTEIDKSSCIWRMNNAPTKGYEEDVGKRTTVRVVSHTSVPLLLKNPEYFFKETNSTVYVIWGPFRNMRKDGNGIVYNMLKKAVDSYPSAKIYVTTEKRMSYCDAVFKRETGKDR